MTLHAIFIGIDTYADQSIPDLRFARADAEELSTTFTTSSYGDAIQAHLLLDANATRHNILQLIGTEVPLASEEEDLAFIYFACHGAPEADESLDASSRFLVCHDTNRGSLLSSGLDLEVDLLRLVRRLRTALVVFMVDACFSGYSGGRGIIGSRLERLRRTHRPGPKLTPLELGRGTVFISAAGHDEVAREDASLGHGVFSYFLLSELRSSGKDTVIGLPTLYDSLNKHVRTFTRERQHPEMWGEIKGAGLPRLPRLDA